MRRGLRGLDQLSAGLLGGLLGRELQLAELKLELSEMQQLLVDPGELVEVCEHPHGPQYVPKAMRGFSA